MCVVGQQCRVSCQSCSLKRSRTSWLWMRTFSTTSWSKLSRSFSRASRCPRRSPSPARAGAGRTRTGSAPACGTAGRSPRCAFRSRLRIRWRRAPRRWRRIRRRRAGTSRRAAHRRAGPPRWLVEEVDDDHVELLAVAVAAADALLDALRVPGQIVVHHEVAELEVDALGGGFGGDQNRGLVAEVLDQRRTHVGGGRTGDAVGARVLAPASVVDAFDRGRCWCR